MGDRSSRSHRSPRRTPARCERRVIKLRVLQRWGPARIAGHLGMHTSTVHRILTDNGACYKSRAWREALASQGIKHKRTRPYRPQTNGKVERFNRTLAEEWAYARPYTSEAQRREAFTGWLYHYNHCETWGGWSGTGRSE